MHQGWFVNGLVESYYTRTVPITNYVYIDCYRYNF